MRPRTSVRSAPTRSRAAVAASPATRDRRADAPFGNGAGRGVRRTVSSVDPVMLDAFRRRDPDAVRAFYREYGRLVYAVAHRVLGRHDLAEDAVQQTFVNAWQAADRFDITRDPASWLATIARRTAIDIYRRESRRPASPLAEVRTDNPAVVSLPPDLEAVDS